MRVLFPTKYGKFNVDSKNGKKVPEKIDGFPDN